MVGTYMGEKFRNIKQIIEREGLSGEELTAKEIYRVLENEEVAFSSPHEVATVLGRNRDDPELTVVEETPYRYRFELHE